MKKIIPVFLLVFFLISQVSLPAAAKGNPGQDSFSIEEITPFSYVCISHKGPFSDMEKVIGMLQSSECFGFGVTAGFRSLNVGLSFEDPSSSTGYSSPTMLGGELVTVDIGGTYMTTGLLIRF